jgi:hypothetical protein
LGDLSLPESHRGPLLALQVRDSVESGYFLCIIDRRRGKRGVVERPLTDEQKAAIAEARRVHDAKVAGRDPAPRHAA